MSHLTSLFSSTDRVALITGGGTGLGFWMAETWVKNGGKVYITGRREAKLQEAVAKLDTIAAGKAFYFVGDVASQDGVDKLLREFTALETLLDVLVNNAGTTEYDVPAPGAPLAAFDQGAWGRQMNLHVWSPAAVTSAFAPLLIVAAKRGEGRGNVINISSVTEDLWNASSKLTGVAFQSNSDAQQTKVTVHLAYSASKAAEGALTNILANKLVKHGVRVNTIKPGTFPSELNDINDPTSSSARAAEIVPMRRNGGADDLAGAFLFLATRAGAYTTGQRISIDGGSQNTCVHDMACQVSGSSGGNRSDNIVAIARVIDRPDDIADPQAWGPRDLQTSSRTVCAYLIVGHRQLFVQQELQAKAPGSGFRFLPGIETPLTLVGRRPARLSDRNLRLDTPTGSSSHALTLHHRHISPVVDDIQLSRISRSLTSMLRPRQTSASKHPTEHRNDSHVLDGVPGMMVSVLTRTFSSVSEYLADKCQLICVPESCVKLRLVMAKDSRFCSKERAQSSMSLAANLFDATGRIAVITGGGTGLGFWMAEAWVKNGGKVYITGRREETLKAAVDKLNIISNGNAFCIPADVSNQAEIDKLAKELSGREKAIDVLVNNAGTGAYDVQNPDAPLPAFDSAAWVRQFTVNSWAPAAVTSALAPLLIEAAKKGEGRGSVILIGSIAEEFWFSSYAGLGYSLSKVAENALTKTLANKLISHGVRVNTIKPGTFPSAMNDASNPAAGSHPDQVKRNVPMKRNGNQDDITAIFLYFATKASAYVTGQDISVDGGWTLVANGRD
ncbi:hypothetical protein EVG20_g6697 [Dentipellis fragilis]|uniref:Uncharacterized protein n=1 Tax=Dentipellis fragilis TaxID=205917 RepID=A0A4Y9YIU7_9AGAM|nr:hypothetical protein EVG20_g6697 [Dentipellis fragilis]